MLRTMQIPTQIDSFSSMWAPDRNTYVSSPASERRPRIVIDTITSPAAKKPSKKPKTPSPISPVRYGDPSLQKFDSTVNMEAYQQNVLNAPPHSLYCLVLDTNVLLGYLDALTQFVKDAEKCAAPVVIVVPGIVVQELDYQKTHKSLQWNSRLASTWILDQVKLGRFVTGQAYHETLQTSGHWKKKDIETTNDELIVDCALYLKNKRRRVIMVSADKNLLVNAIVQGLPTANPRDEKEWSSRSLALSTFNDQCDIDTIATHFGGPLGIRKPQRERKALEETLGQQPPPKYLEYEGMDIDDGFDINAEPTPEHLLDNLHKQIQGHFSSILIELSNQKAKEYDCPIISPGGKHAAKPIRLSIQFLCSHGLRYMPTPVSQADKTRLTVGNSRLADFMTDAYGERGRKGQEWARADWYFCLETLEMIGRVWRDESIRISMGMLLPQVEMDFLTPMRPS